MKLWAHRGSHGAGGPLENTMAAFEKAIVDGADGIELDVHLSVDGIPIVFHDETLERLTPSGDKRCIGQVSADELLHLELHNSARMPTLAQVLTEIGPHIHLNIEIKDAEGVDAVVALVRGYEDCNVLISSFSAPAIHHASQVAPTIDRAWISGDLPATSSEQAASRWPFATLLHTEASRWHTSNWFCNPMTVALLAARGVETHVWTINDPKRAQEMVIMGVHGIFTDTPGQLRSALSTK